MPTVNDAIYEVVLFTLKALIAIYFDTYHDTD